MVMNSLFGKSKEVVKEVASKGSTGFKGLEGKVEDVVISSFSRVHKVLVGTGRKVKDFINDGSNVREASNSKSVEKSFGYVKSKLGSSALETGIDGVSSFTSTARKSPRKFPTSIHVHRGKSGYFEDFNFHASPVSAYRTLGLRQRN